MIGILNGKRSWRAVESVVDLRAVSLLPPLEDTDPVLKVCSQVRGSVSGVHRALK
jgi:hypothetical protein